LHFLPSLGEANPSDGLGWFKTGRSSDWQVILLAGLPVSF